MVEKRFAARFFFPVAFLSITTLFFLIFLPVSQSHAMSDPRLGLITSTQATIYWDTDTRRTGQLRCVGLSYDHTFPTEEDRTGTHHRATATGLLPSTTYQFTAESDGYLKEGQFTTAAVNKNIPFQFITMADNRGPDAPTDAQGLPTQFLSIIQDASNRVGAASPGYVAFAVNGGDIFGTKDINLVKDSSPVNLLYRRFKEATDSLAKMIPYLVSPGNHEFTRGLGYDPVQEFNDNLAQPTFLSWDWGNSHFVIIDTSTEMYFVDDDQLKWLDTDLQTARAAGARHIFVIGHSEAFAGQVSPWKHYDSYMGNYLNGDPKYDYPAQRDKLWAILANYNVDAYICGHEHMFDDSINSIVPQWLNGNAGAPTNPGAPDRYQYTLWTVEGDTVTAQLISSSGNVDYRRTFASRQPIHITHGPRLGLITSTEATIYWDTDASGNGQLRYGTTTSSYGPPLPTQDDPTGAHHRITITGLLPSTNYYFRAETGDASAEGRFTTATTTKDASFQFITMADNRGPGPAKWDVEHGLPEAFLNIIQDASNRVGAASPGFIAFAVNGGDIFATGVSPQYPVYPGIIDPLYMAFKDATDPLATKIPYLVSPGNHEFVRINDKSQTYDPAGKFNEHLAQPNQLAGYDGTVFSWDWGNSHFVVIDTSTKMMEVADDQLTWLDADLKTAQAAGARHIFVIGHAQAYFWKDTAWYMGQWDERPGYPAQRDKFWAVLAKYNVDAYICGHAHEFYGPITVNGVVQWLNGNSGVGELDQGAPPNLWQYTIWTVDGETVKAELIRDTGEVDQVSSFTSRQPFPHGGEKVATITPTLRVSPSSEPQGARWFVMDSSGNVAFTTRCPDESGIGHDCFDSQNLTQFTVPAGILQFDRQYTWQMEYRDTSGNVAYSATSAFSTPSKPANTNNYGVPVAVNEVNDESGTPIGVINKGNLAGLQKDSTFRASVPQIDTVGTIITKGSVTDASGNVIPVNPSGFGLVKSKGGTGQPLAMVVGGSGTIASVSSISDTGRAMDISGNMVQAATFAMPTGVSLPYGVCDFVVTVTAGSTTKIIIVPPQPFDGGTKWYKLDGVAGTLKQYPYFEVTADGNGILTLTDNGAGDDNPTSGVIRDPGGPGITSSVVEVGGGGSGGACFIATAAYGSYFHPYVEVLRRFRDAFLMGNIVGRSFVAWYYRVSPPIADTIRTSGIMKAGVRMGLLPAVGISYFCLTIGVGPTIVILVLFLTLAFLSLSSAQVQTRASWGTKQERE